MCKGIYRVFRGFFLRNLECQPNLPDCTVQAFRAYKGNKP